MGELPVIRPLARSAGGRPEYMAEAIEDLVSAPTPAEGFGALAGRLLSWLSCQLVVLQVKVGAPEPLLFQGGGAVTIPGIGVGWRGGDSPSFSPFHEGECVVHDDLQSFTFGEDANLSRAGMRSAARGALFAGGREIGRFGLFAEAAGHFTPERVRILKEVTPALVWLCRQAAFTAQMTAETEASGLMDEVIGAASQGLHAALRACRTHVTRILPAAGVLAMIEIPSARPAVLIDSVGITVPGVPNSEEPAAWHHWLGGLPPEGRVDSVAWIFPIPHEGLPVGVLAVAFPQSHENPERWHHRLRPMISFLAMLVELERNRRQANLDARIQLGSLASGLADEIGNLFTELALQVDLLQGHLLPGREALQRRDALMRLVEKGTGLSTRLEQMATSQRHPDMWEPLTLVIERVVQHLRTYQGGKHIALQSQVGEAGDGLVDAGMVEHALTQLALSMGQNRTSEVRVVLRGHPSPLQPGHLVLWLSEAHEESEWQPDGSTRTFMLEVPIRSRT